MAIVFLTDSTSDISHEEGGRRGITVIPLRVSFDDDTYRDGVDIGHDTFYQMLTAAQNLPTTSQPTPEDFLPAFLQAKAAGDDLICILLSANLSGTVQSALIAREICDYDRISVVDSQQAVTGLRLLVDLACLLRDEGHSAPHIVQQIEDARGRVQLYAMVDTLTYLHKGGRLSSAVTVVGTLMKVKPLLQFKAGSLEMAGKGLGAKDAMDKILKKLSGSRPDPRLPVYFGYTHDRKQGDALRALTQAEYDFPRTEMHSVGAVIGTHVGPRAAVITYLEQGD